MQLMAHASISLMKHPVLMLKPLVWITPCDRLPDGVNGWLKNLRYDCCAKEAVAFG